MMNDVLDLCENGAGESNRKTKRFRTVSVGSFEVD